MSSLNRDEILAHIDGALSSLVNQDRQLIRVNVNERTIGARLCLHLTPLFPDWHVDAEYNRDGHHPKAIHLPYHPRFNSKDQPTTRVSPDIIIHHRETTENLVVMEVKKSANKDREEFEFDRLKLHHYKLEPLSYAIALFIVVETDGSLGRPYTIEEVE